MYANPEAHRAYNRRYRERARRAAGVRPRERADVICPECASPKHRQSRRCAACYTDARRRGEYPDPPRLTGEANGRWKATGHTGKRERLPIRSDPEAARRDALEHAAGCTVARSGASAV